MADVDARNAVWIRSVVGRYEQPLLRYVTRLLDDLEAAVHGYRAIIRACLTPPPRAA